MRFSANEVQATVYVLSVRIPIESPVLACTVRNRWEDECTGMKRTGPYQLTIAFLCFFYMNGGVDFIITRYVCPDDHLFEQIFTGP